MSFNLEIIIVALLLSTIGGGFIIEPMINCLRRKITDSPPYTELARYIGILDRALYVFALAFGYPNFIAVWLGFKVASKWNLWHEEYKGQSTEESNKGRARFQIFLIGNAMSILAVIFSILLTCYLYEIPIQDFL